MWPLEVEVAIPPATWPPNSSWTTLSLHTVFQIDSPVNGTVATPKLIGFVEASTRSFYRVGWGERMGGRKALRALAQPTKTSPPPFWATTSKPSPPCPRSAKRPPRPSPANCRTLPFLRREAPVCGPWLNHNPVALDRQRRLDLGGTRPQTRRCPRTRAVKRPTPLLKMLRIWCVPSWPTPTQYLILEAPRATRRHHGRRHRLKTVATSKSWSPQTNVAIGPRHPLLQAAWDRLDGAVPTERRGSAPARNTPKVSIASFRIWRPPDCSENLPTRHRECHRVQRGHHAGPRSRCSLGGVDGRSSD